MNGGDLRSDGAAVDVRLSAIHRRLRQNGYDGITLEFRPAVPGDALPAVRAALDVANDLHPTVYADGISASVRGPFVHLKSVATTAETDAWVLAFASGLEQAGWSGTVDAAKQVFLPKEMEDHTRPRLTGYVGYELAPGMADAPVPWPWGVEPGLTETLCREAVAWGAHRGAEVYLWESRGQIQVGEPDVTELLVAALDRSASTGVTYVTRSPVLVHRASFHARGQATYQVEDQALEWQQRVQRLRAVLLAHPARVDLGFVRWSYGWAYSWNELANALPRMPFVDEGTVCNHRRLWRDYTPDAHGIQLLTANHLAKGPDLSAWEVSQVAPDRFLVQARDLAPWFAGDGPDLDVVERARRDFGDMLLTPERVRPKG